MISSRCTSIRHSPSMAPQISSTGIGTSLGPWKMLSEPSVVRVSSWMITSLFMKADLGFFRLYWMATILELGEECFRPRWLALF